MPLGTHHIVTGMLCQAKRGFELHVDGGGVWALDASKRVRKLVGQRVGVEGVRAGFDLLEVRRIDVEKRAVPILDTMNAGRS